MGSLQLRSPVAVGLREPAVGESLRGTPGLYKVLYATATGAGTLARRTSRGLASAPVLVGSIVKRAPRTLGGAVVATGSLVAYRVFFAVLDGVVGVVGSLASYLGVRYLLGLAGTLQSALVGTLAREIGAARAGTAQVVGTLARGTAKTLADGTVGAVGSGTRQAHRLLGGAAGVAGAVVVGWFYRVALAGVLAPVGQLARRAGKQLVGAGTVVGGLVRRTGRAVVGVLAPAGAVATGGRKLVGGTLGPAGAVVRSTGYRAVGTLHPVGTVAKASTRFLVGAAGATGALARRSAVALSGSTTTAGIFAWSWALRLDAALAPVGTLVRATRATLVGGAVAVAGALAKRSPRTLVGVLHAIGLLGVGPSLPVVIPVHVLFGHGDVDPGEVAWFDEMTLPLEFWYLDQAGTRRLGFNLDKVRRIVGDPRVVWLPPLPDLPVLAWADVADKQRGDPFTSDRLLELL